MTKIAAHVEPLTSEESPAAVLQKGRPCLKGRSLRTSNKPKRKHMERLVSGSYDVLPSSVPCFGTGWGPCLLHLPCQLLARLHQICRSGRKTCTRNVAESIAALPFARVRRSAVFGSMDEADISCKTSCQQSSTEALPRCSQYIRQKTNVTAAHKVEQEVAILTQEKLDPVSYHKTSSLQSSVLSFISTMPANLAT